MSNRQKKKMIKQGAAKLREKPGWDPSSFTPANPRERLRELVQESRNTKAYDEATQCQGCADARAESGDETALCETHLMAAIGF